MSDLWREDPEAFIILRLQESSDPDSAHRAFQSVLAELARLREENREHAFGEQVLTKEYADLEAENARLREENENLREAHGPGKCVRQARPEVLLERDDALKETT